MAISWGIAKFAVKGFFTAYGKWMVIGLITVAFTSFVWFIYSAFKERDELLEERKMTITNLAVEVNSAEISKQLAEDALKRMIEDEARMKLLYNNTLALQDNFATEMAKQIDVLEKHNLTELTNAKPRLIETRANAATKERFNEVMSVVNN